MFLLLQVQEIAFLENEGKRVLMLMGLRQLPLTHSGNTREIYPREIIRLLSRDARTIRWKNPHLFCWWIL